MNASELNSLASMHGLQQKLNIISNNIANVDTVGYKSKDAEFQTVLTSLMSQPKGFQLQGRLTPLGVSFGNGVKLAPQQMDASEGSLKVTDQATDLAIQGDGLFAVNVHSTDAAGNVTDRTAWTRDGSFKLTPDAQGNRYLGTAQGHLVLGTSGNPIQVPQGDTIRVDAKGRVFGVDAQGNSTQLDQLQLGKILKPDALQPIGDNLLEAPAGAAPNSVVSTYDPTQVSQPDITVRQGALEQSNVNLAQQMSELTVVERQYQLSARALANADAMMNMASNLHG